MKVEPDGELHMASLLRIPECMEHLREFGFTEQDISAYTKVEADIHKWFETSDEWQTVKQCL